MATKDYEELLACLRESDVRALIVGGHAVAFHAKPRFTKDIDIFVEPSKENAERILRALEAFGLGSLDLDIDDFSTPGKIVQLGMEPNRVDIITSIGSVTFEEAWTHRVEGRFGEESTFYLGLRELIRSKEDAGRPQDLADLEWLRQTVYKDAT